MYDKHAISIFAPGVGYHVAKGSSHEKGWKQTLFWQLTLTGIPTITCAPCVPTRISNHMIKKCGMELLIHFQIFGILEWISNFIPHFITNIITYPCLFPLVLFQSTLPAPVTCTYDYHTKCRLFSGGFLWIPKGFDYQLIQHHSKWPT